MERFGVLRNVAYGAKRGGGTVDKNSLSELAKGAVVVVNDKGEIIAAPGVDPVESLADVKQVTIHVGLSSTEKETNRTNVFGAIVRKNIIDYNLHANTPTSTPTSYNLDASGVSDSDEGELYMVVKRVGYNTLVNSGRVSITVTKKAGTTSAQLIDAINEQLQQELPGVPQNARGPLFYETTDNGSDLDIASLDQDDEIILSLDTDLNVTYTKTDAVNSVTRGKEVVALEKDRKANEGFGNYQELNDLWDTSPIEAEADETYRILNIREQGVHDFPANKGNAAVKLYTFAIADNAGSDFLKIMASVVGEAFDATDGAEVGEATGDNEVNQDDTD